MNLENSYREDYLKMDLRRYKRDERGHVVPNLKKW